MAPRKRNGAIQSKYGAGGSRQRKLNARAGRAAVPTTTRKPKSGWQVFEETLYKRGR